MTWGRGRGFWGGWSPVNILLPREPRLAAQCVVADDTLAGRKDFTSQPRVTLGIAKMLLAANNLNAPEFPLEV
jgi:hypothetical protein